MITVQKSEERRHIQNKNQSTWMTFDPESKANPLRIGFGVLKILNEEILPPGDVFTFHTAEAMIIITYVREGMIIYKGPFEKPDFVESKEFQRSSADPKTKQYAFNVSQTEDAHVFQCGFSLNEFVSPIGEGGFISNEVVLKQKVLKKLFTQAERQGILRLIASADGKDSSLSIERDVQMYSTFIHKGNHIIHEIGPGRSTWLHVVKGHILLNNLQLHDGDGVGSSDERSVSFTAKGPAEILLFDLCATIPEKTIILPLSSN